MSAKGRTNKLLVNPPEWCCRSSCTQDDKAFITTKQCCVCNVQHASKVNLDIALYIDTDMGQFSEIILLYRKTQSISVWKAGLLQMLVRQLILPSTYRMHSVRGGECGGYTLSDRAWEGGASEFLLPDSLFSKCSVSQGVTYLQMRMPSALLMQNLMYCNSGVR